MRMDFRIIALISLIPFSYPQFIRIHDISNNPGALIMKVGEGRISLGYDKVLHIIELNQPQQSNVAFKTKPVFLKEGSHMLILKFNLYPFRIILKQYKTIINKLEENSNIIEIVNILKQKHSQAYFVLENLTIKRRKAKRSLNFLGSTIKMITGNLDNEDLLKIENQLESLKYSNNALITENNEQVTVKVIWNIIFNIDMIHHQLMPIFESIQLSKLGIISKTFLQPPELEFTTQLLESKGISIESYDQTYEFLEPVAFHNDSDIIVLIKIPKLRRGEYVQLHIETIPINGKIIAINATNAIVGNNESYLVEHPCNNIEKNSICDIQNLFNISNDKCLHPILRGNPGTCTFTKPSTLSKFKSIENLGVLIKNSIEPTLMQNSCGFGSRNLTGTYLVSFENCSIKLNGTQFNNKIFKGKTKPTILLLHLVNVNESELISEPITNLELLHVHNRHKLEHLETITKRTRVFNIGAIVLITCLVITFVTLIIREVCKLKLKLIIRIPIDKVADSSQSGLNRDGSI
ncbi:uncharacterized protein LOC131434323 [Malaya genurostris]|uniref:uncharacterized protein LOC131434323 n=1 Tax=Malaya genurostris TaxID=325434 RepID=UPI0026F3B951|nr:uncharacterized protein LOC131434323 [Malaya genurostris]